jgi:hypothetical protein
MRIIDRLRYNQQIKNMPTGGTPKENPLLKKQLEDTQNQLNSILTEWNWGGKSPSTAHEFLNKFKPWVDEKLKLGKDVESFLKEQSATSLEELVQTWQNTEEYYLEQIKELKESKGGSEEVEELIAERDELARDKTTLEQETLSLNNKLKLKQQEVNSKDKTIETLKKKMEN